MFWRQSRYDEAFVQAQRAYELFHASGHEAGEAGALNNIGWYHFRLDDHERAMRVTIVTFPRATGIDPDN